MSLKSPYIPTTHKVNKTYSDVISLAEWLKKSLDNLKKVYPNKDKKNIKNINTMWELYFWNLPLKLYKDNCTVVIYKNNNYKIIIK